MCPPPPLPRVLSPPQPVSTFPPLHIPLLTETRSPSSSFPPLSPITPSLALVLSTSVCYIDILSLPPYRDTPLTVPPVTLSMTTDLRGKCKVPPHQEIKTLASSRCLTPLTSLIFPHPFLHIPLPKSPLYYLLFCFLFPPFSHLSQRCFSLLLLVPSYSARQRCCFQNCQLPTAKCWSVTEWNDGRAEFDTRRLFSHLLHKVHKSAIIEKPDFKRRAAESDLWHHK